MSDWTFDVHQRMRPAETPNGSFLPAGTALVATHTG